MQETSALYKQLLATAHTKETRLAIGESMGADNGFDESKLMSMKTFSTMFSEDTVSLGSCVSSEIDITMLLPETTIPRQAKLVPYVRLTDGTKKSEWIQKGVYYVDTRKTEDSGNGILKLVLHGYDAMLRAEQDYPTSNLDWPAKDLDVLDEIVTAMNVEIDSRTLDIMTESYMVQYPAGYTCREVLGYIAAMYAGCFIMSDLGRLRLVPLWALPIRYAQLATENDEIIITGGVSIRV